MLRPRRTGTTYNVLRLVCRRARRGCATELLHALLVTRLRTFYVVGLAQSPLVPHHRSQGAACLWPHNHQAGCGHPGDTGKSDRGEMRIAARETGSEMGSMYGSNEDMPRHIAAHKACTSLSHPELACKGSPALGPLPGAGASQAGAAAHPLRAAALQHAPRAYGPKTAMRGLQRPRVWNSIGGVRCSQEYANA